MKTKEKCAGGRPTAYKSEYTEQAYNYCLLGATDVQLAEFFSVTESTINLWKKKQPEFANALKRGKMLADARVVHSLFKRANGYSHPETHINFHEGKIVQSEITKHYPPDTTACIFWLKNRQPKYWRDKVEIKEEINLNAFPSKEELDAIYENALEEARKRNEILIGRRERLGIKYSDFKETEEI
ncbi:MAG: helix-turn-helix domain-containing protein [Betaproteobacteria bacterium]|nr:helix-turn-helix domain-containing protein [Betaproteobacteria bacterium]